MGTPFLKDVQVARNKGDASTKEASPFSFPDGRALKFNAQFVKNADDESENFLANTDFLPGNASLIRGVGRPSIPATLSPRTNKSGSISYRVTVTIKGLQRKRVTRDLEVAQQTRELWELERLTNRPVLSAENIHDAIAANQLKKGMNLTLVDCVQIAKREAVKSNADSKAKTIDHLSFGKAFKMFLAARQDVDSLQYDTIRRRCTGLEKFFGADRAITELTSELIEEFFKSREFPKRKTWNNYRGDVSVLTTWLHKKRFLASNPIDGVEKFSKRATAPAPPKRMSVQMAREMMTVAERDYPEWCTLLAVCLFAGVRPDLRGGEIWKLSNSVAEDGVVRYFFEDRIYISAAIAKDKRDRSTKIHENLAAWLKAYPPTPKTVLPGDYDAMKPLRDQFDLKSDIMRHTCISAFVSLGHSFSDAAEQFGNSEAVIRRHYHSRMNKAEAEEFYRILPTGRSRDCLSHTPSAN